TYQAKPLLKVPKAVKDDPIIHAVIDGNPHLFKIVMPINIDIFEHYVSFHPNHCFTASVCHGLQHGLWSQASYCPSYPPTFDASSQHPKQSPEEEDFIYSQCELEVALGWFSPAFGSDLLLGMYSMPVHAVPKAIQNFHMVTNHSCGEFLLNSMVERDAIEGQSPLDTLKSLADSLLAL
ncbi:hypothetical protein BDQ17DRAFT_1244606, partial [Cyathus striatus]